MFKFWFYKLFFSLIDRRGGVLAVALALATACAEPGLNSERIAQRYGSYGVELIEQSQDARLSCLYSRHGERHVCRTVAMVWFQQPVDPELTEADRLIRGGASIGATFQRLGWHVEKANIDIGEYRLKSPDMGSRMDVAVPAALAMHIYLFRAERDGRRLNYATIVELHHPDYLDRKDVERLYRRLPDETLTTPELAAIRARARAAIGE